MIGDNRPILEYFVGPGPTKRSADRLRRTTTKVGPGPTKHAADRLRRTGSEVGVHPFFDHPLPLAIAHRGGSLDGIENTIASFAAAIDMGYRYLETDVRVTADGELVVFHDLTLDRVLRRPGRLRDLTWAELSKLLVGGREPVPRLAEVLTTWPDVRFVIDPKCDAAVEPLIRVLRAHDAVDRVCIGSFSDDRLRAMRRAFGPALCTSMGPAELVRLRLAASRLLPVRAVPRAARCVQMPLRYGPVRFTEPRCIALAHRLGLQVHVWTINDPATMRRLLDLGVDAIMTDDVGALRDVLRSRELWHAR
jgi:glycerophosphoryl diester phosphodiesterase